MPNEALIEMLRRFASGHSRTRDSVSDLEEAFARADLDNDERFADLGHALAMFGAGMRADDDLSLANECSRALSILAPTAPVRARRIIYVDVDDTLVRSFGSKRIPMPAVIDQIRRLKSEGAELYCWSSGGADYCRSTAVELGILECFVAFLPKPQIYIDDQPIADWRNCTYLHPNEAPKA